MPHIPLLPFLYLRQVILMRRDEESERGWSCAASDTMSDAVSDSASSIERF